MEQDSYEDMLSNPDLLSDLPSFSLTADMTGPARQNVEVRQAGKAVETSQVQQLPVMATESASTSVLTTSNTPESISPKSPATLLGDDEALSNDGPAATHGSRTGDAMVIQEIENVVDEVVDCLAERKSLFIPLKRRHTIKSAVSRNGGSTPASRSEGVSFPGSTPQEAWRFSRTPEAQGRC